jgi:hypothetical protein
MTRPSRLFRILIVLLVGGVSALVAMILVTLASGRHSDRTSNAQTQEAPTRVASNTRSDPTRPHPVEVQPVLATSKPHQADPATLPDSRELNRQYPGFAKAYMDASYAAEARSEARIQRRCQASLPETVKEIKWETAETFEPSSDGTTLVRTDIQFVPAADEYAAFTKCLASSTPNDGSVKIAMPEQTPIHDTIQLRNSGVIFVNDYTNDEIAQELVSLRERIADPALTADQRATLQDHLELWECYERLGLAHRRECLSR